MFPRVFTRATGVPTPSQRRPVKNIATGNSQMFPRVFTRATGVPTPSQRRAVKKHRHRKFANVPQSVHKGHTQVYQLRAKGDQ